MHKGVTLGLALICVGVAHSARAGCLLPSLEHLLTSPATPVIFRGIVVDLTTTPFERGSEFGQDQRATFLVSRVWKGDVAELAVVENRIVQSYTGSENDGIANPAGGLLELYREYLVSPLRQSERLAINGYSCVTMPFEWVQVGMILRGSPGRQPAVRVPAAR